MRNQIDLENRRRSERSDGRGAIPTTLCLFECGLGCHSTCHYKALYSHIWIQLDLHCRRMAEAGQPQIKLSAKRLTSSSFLYLPSPWSCTTIDPAPHVVVIRASS